MNRIPISFDGSPVRRLVRRLVRKLVRSLRHTAGRTFRVCVGRAGLGILACLVPGPAAGASQPACGPDRVEASVAVAGGEFTLADLLASSSCPALRKAAAAVPLGRAPLAGSVRVFDGENVRAQVQKLEASETNPGRPTPSLDVPPRITVRRAGARASCAELAAKLLAGAGATAGGRRALSLPPDRVSCGAADRIPDKAPLQLMRETWDAALGSWEISARCIQPADCVPFLVWMRGRISPSEATGAVSAQGPLAASTPNATGTVAAEIPGRPPLVRPGETATLSWDQDGIRLVVPVVCLDRGQLGQTVRARILAGNRTLAAIVTGPETLRAAP